VSSRRRPPRPAAVRQAPRRVRLNELLREVVGEELMRIADERLELVSVTAVDVDNDLNRAIVYFDSLAGEAGDADVLEALGEHRRALQRAIGRQIHARKTPVLEFRPDDVIRSAERIERILRELPPTSEGDDRPT
jgi:ribosome-binding factor A